MPNKSTSSTIPALFLRRAWFHILQHVIKHPEAYRVYFASALKIDIKLDSLRNDLITVIQPSKVNFGDPDEQKLYDEGIVTKSGKIDLRFDGILKINAHVAVICEAVNIAGEFGRNLDGYINKTRKIDGKIPKGSVIQTVVHAALSNFKMTDEVTCFFGPQKHAISRDIALKVLNYSYDIIPFIFEEDEGLITLERKKVNELRELVKDYNKRQPGTLNDDEANDSVVAMHHKFWQNSRYLAPFQETQWLMLIRTDSNRNLNDRLGIVVNTVKFETIKAGYLACRMHGMYYSSQNNTPVSTDYSGLATCGRKKQYMHIEWIRDLDEENEFQTAFLSIRINEIATQNLMLGHYTYYSNRCHKYLTKMVVFYKFDENDCFITSNFQTGENKLPDFMADYVKHLNRFDDPVEFEKIPQDIRILLHSRTENRLTMPGEPVVCLNDSSNSLQSFITKFYEKMQEETILQTFCGEYVVCYYYGENKIEEFTDSKIIEKNLRIDIMKITFNEDSLAFDVNYLHRRSETQIEEFEGTVTRKQGSIEVVLRPKTRTKHRPKSPEENYMFLIIAIPHDAIDFDSAFKSSKIFPAIISGLKDGRFIPVAHYAVISRPAFLLEENEEKQIKIKDVLHEKVMDHFKRKGDHLGIIVNPNFSL